MSTSTDWTIVLARDRRDLMQGPVNPANNAVAIKPELSCFDGIHPNPDGYRAMGAFIDLNLFH